MSQPTYQERHAADKSSSTIRKFIAAGSVISLALAGAGAALAASAGASVADFSRVTPAADPRAPLGSSLAIQRLNQLLAQSPAARHAQIALTADRTSAPQRPAVITVRAGNTLSGISTAVYGEPKCWPGIFRANPSIGPDPDVITVGERLTIPRACSVKLPYIPHAAAATEAVSEPATGESPGGAAPVPAPASGGLSGQLSFSQLEQLWEAAGGPAWAAPQAASIAECESGGNQYAQNPSGAAGYWQILGEVISGNVFDPMVNAENAVAKFHDSRDTFAQWVCR